ncbi:Photosystem I assembly protein Ycf3 [Pseudodesulfovibrio profundus]|uniref:Photosystem I assembly protein Ycf3 n=1 Tax=Pseudodesulfovibrio profundus TaxID=57320 RepID=A0A2C8F757_9BACT|nr:Photosystem I assembly protein Ycf3 [Pseudodesulfovibrio profundus]
MECCIDCFFPNSNHKSLESAVNRLATILILILSLTMVACGQDVSELMAEGDQYLKEGNYQGAIVIYKTVLEDSPESMEARLGLAKAYLETGKISQAESNFEKYIRQNPYDKSVLIDMAKINSYEKDYDAAIGYLKDYIKEYPESSEAYQLLGKNYWALGDKPNTLQSLQKAVEVAPSDNDARFTLAQFIALEDGKEEADNLVAAILQDDPNHRDALLYRSRAEMAAGDLEKYQATLNQILANHPDDAFVKYALAKSYIAQARLDEAQAIADELKQTAPDTAFGNKIQGLVRYGQRDFKGAIDSFLEAVSIHPDLEGYFNLGLSYYNKGDLETAISNLRIAADRSDKFINAREMISLILLQQNRVDESIAEAQKVLEVDPQSVTARVILSDAYTLKGEPEKALQYAKKASEERPDFTGAYLKIGSLEYERGDMNKTESALRQAMDSAPQALRPKIVLASFYLSQSNKKQAKRVLEDGLTGAKGDVPLYVFLARLALQDNNADEAREYLAKAKEADPSVSRPYLMLASMNLATRQPDAAIAEYDELLQNRPGSMQGLIGKAGVLDMLDKHDEAVELYKKALESGHPRAYLSYAGSLLKRKQDEAGLAILDQGLAKHPNDPFLSNVKARTLLRHERYDEVIAMSEEIGKERPGVGLAMRTRVYVLKGEFETAMAEAEKMIEFSPKESQGYLVLADIHLRQSDNSAALTALERGLENCGPLPDLLLEISKRHMAGGEDNKALTYLDAAIKRNDKFYKAHSLKGDVYSRMGRNSKAIESYQKALDISEVYVPALNNLAMLYLEDAKMKEEALRLAYNAYLQAPWETAVLDTFGYALAVNDRADEAVMILEKAAVNAADNKAISYHLGYAYAKAGKKDRAREELAKVVDCSDCDNVENARKLLDSLGNG